MNKQTRASSLILLLMIGFMEGCVSLSTYKDLQARYEMLIESKVAAEQEAADARRQLLAIREQQARVAGQVAALEESLAGRIHEAVSPLNMEIASLKTDRASVLRERQRQDQLEADRHRAVVERLDHLSAMLDRLSDRVTRTEVLIGRMGSQPTPKKTDTKESVKKPAPSSESPAPKDPTELSQEVPKEPIGQLSINTSSISSVPIK